MKVQFIISSYIRKEKTIVPKISVIVPVYNVEAYLKRCVDSILAQTFTDFELILSEQKKIMLFRYNHCRKNWI